MTSFLRFHAKTFICRWEECERAGQKRADTKWKNVVVFADGGFLSGIGIEALHWINQMRPYLSRNARTAVKNACEWRCKAHIILFSKIPYLPGRRYKCTTMTIIPPLFNHLSWNLHSKATADPIIKIYQSRSRIFQRRERTLIQKQSGIFWLRISSQQLFYQDDVLHSYPATISVCHSLVEWMN